MAKYISAEYHKKFSKFVPELQRKTTLTDLWNIIYDKFNIEASITVGKTVAKIKYTLREKTYELERPSAEIIVVGPNGDTKEENYDLLIKDALDHMLQNKLLKEPKTKTSKREKLTDEQRKQRQRERAVKRRQNKKEKN